MSVPAHRTHPHLPLVLLAAAVLGLLSYRGYGPQITTRPTEHFAVTSNPIDLNAADRAELLQIPGIGPSLADAILTHRRAVGRFDRVEDLAGVRGIAEKTIDKLRPWVKVGEADPEHVAREPKPPVEQLERKPKPKPLLPASVPATKVQPGETIDVNAVTTEELQRLPGIGPALAARIVAEREKKPYSSIEELRRVSGIGPKTLEKLRPFVVVK